MLYFFILLIQGLICPQDKMTVYAKIFATYYILH